MDNLSLEQKQAQFDEFFMIAHPLKINITPLDDDFTLPDTGELDDVMPYAFRIANEMSSIQSQALRPLRGLSDHATELVDYLHLQSRKIDLMMSYILQQQDEPDTRFEALKFGGGGIVVHHHDVIPVGTKAELKLFLNEEAAAIFCYGEVITCQQAEDEYHIAFIFNRIREEDQELLVRASLHLQTQQLRKRSQKRNQS
ncbi:PilZ domain-containing protein [Alteromonas sp. ASW11-130]|uniref:PilZ domain-containing protein n=1 Tax=Alteromonas sp. ASW11-130 TaxID=3015775 RepID=UPI002242858C|nr:PilZ domain-containing protein [Alteromonas sp. ASW11-130]MCW8090614.1 PilZ domain-containing protein [Alteromonas sp. ASW11-130]